MKKASLVLGLVVLCIAIVVGWLQRTPSTNAPGSQVTPVPEVAGAPPDSTVVPARENAAAPSDANVATHPSAVPAKAAPSIATNSTPRTPARTEPASPPVPMEEVRTEIEDLQVSFRDYRTVLGENPVGTNAEITHALIGNNPKQLRLPVPPGSSVNADGELCDRWGTPYFFHQLSAKQMEIHSAGPDRKMGTGDDLVVK